MKRDDNDSNLIRLLSSVGELYLNGFSPKIENLYPKIESPVPRGTQSISSLIKWDHGKSYFVRKFPDYYNHVSSSNYVYSIKLGPSSRYLYELSSEYLILIFEMVSIHLKNFYKICLCGINRIYLIILK
jgi:hypothetical protein